MAERSNVHVRRADSGDAEALAALGRALNLQQRDPAAAFTAEAVRRDGFGGTPRFEAWIAELDQRAVGYALAVPAAYETAYAKAGMYLQDLFVEPTARRRGVGRSLLATVAAAARCRGLEFVWWASRTWNTDSHEFFRTVATVEEPVVAFAAFGDEFTKLANEGDEAP